MKKYLLILLFCPSFYIYPQNIDINILREINVNRITQLDNTFRFITNSATPFAIGTPILLFGIAIVKKDTILGNKSIYIGEAIISTVILTTIMKYSFNRTRPFTKYSFIEKLTKAGSPSFPSGHTSEAFAFATSLSISYPKWYIIAPAFIWASTVGYSRMDLGVHYPSDVLVGAIIGSGCAYLSYIVNNKINKSKYDRIFE